MTLGGVRRVTALGHATALGRPSALGSATALGHATTVTLRPSVGPVWPTLALHPRSRYGPRSRCGPRSVLGRSSAVSDRPLVRLALGPRSGPRFWLSWPSARPIRPSVLGRPSVDLQTSVMARASVAGSWSALGRPEERPSAVRHGLRWCASALGRGLSALGWPSALGPVWLSVLVQAGWPRPSVRRRPWCRRNRAASAPPWPSGRQTEPRSPFGGGETIAAQ